MKKNIREDLRDICLELNDIGIYTLFTFVGHGNVVIKKSFLSDESFNYKDTEEVVERIKYFMSMNGYDSKVFKKKDKSVLSKFNFINYMKDRDKVTQVRINFTNLEIERIFDDILSNK